VVYTGTHDNDTTPGWWATTSAQEKQHALDYLGSPKDGVHWAMVRAAFCSVAKMAIVPLQDVLGLGSDARMNTPSRSDGNWGWRFQHGALKRDLEEKLAALTGVSDRAPKLSDTGEKRNREVREEFAA
jgi:4-alpha-glucanotransferase